MPEPAIDHATNCAGLAALAAIADVPPAALVAPTDPVDYCIVHHALVERARGSIPTSVFRERIHDALVTSGAFALHRRVYGHRVDDGDGRSVAAALWLVLLNAGTVPDDPRSQTRAPDLWLKGDAVYIHYPIDGGMTFVGAVIENDGDPLPVWD